jgi:hypothetical protein
VKDVCSLRVAYKIEWLVVQFLTHWSSSYTVQLFREFIWLLVLFFISRGILTRLSLSCAGYSLCLLAAELDWSPWGHLDTGEAVTERTGLYR